LCELSLGLELYLVLSIASAASFRVGRNSYSSSQFKWLSTSSSKNENDVIRMLPTYCSVCRYSVLDFCMAILYSELGVFF